MTGLSAEWALRYAADYVSSVTIAHAQNDRAFNEGLHYAAKLLRERAAVLAVPERATAGEGE